MELIDLLSTSSYCVRSRLRKIIFDSWLRTAENVRNMGQIKNDTEYSLKREGEGFQSIVLTANTLTDGLKQKI